MYTLPIKNWFTHIHVPNGHSTICWLRHMVHDVRFWVVLVGITMMLALIALMIWAESSGGPNRTLVFPGGPLYPMSY